MTVDVLEKDLQRTVIEMAHVLGWARVYHTHDSRRSQEGFPDLVLVRERIVFLELKREKGKASPAQQLWLRALMVADGEVYVVRPRNLDALGSVLLNRGKPGEGGRVAGAAAHLELRNELMRELS